MHKMLKEILKFVTGKTWITNSDYRPILLTRTLATVMCDRLALTQCRYV